MCTNVRRIKLSENLSQLNVYVHPLGSVMTSNLHLTRSKEYLHMCYHQSLLCLYLEVDRQANPNGYLIVRNVSPS